ncbi:hypothetical protein V2L00_13260 [Pseudomonas alliivorans]|nr:hypothetical protein [Pseudomonas alliivorans]
MSEFIFDDDKKAISIHATTLLVTSAGGRCSYNHRGEYCNKLLSDGRVNLGERAHIVGRNGPRANEPLNIPIHSYENLIWLCRDHHKIIDDRRNLAEYTVEVLLRMKARHERRIITGRYPFVGDGASLHDYGVLSVIFYFCDLHSLYINASEYPKLSLRFFDLSDVCNAFREDRPGDLPLRDPIMRKAFERLEHNHRMVANLYHRSDNGELDSYGRVLSVKKDPNGDGIIYLYLCAVEDFILLLERRFPQILHQGLYDAGI